MSTASPKTSWRNFSEVIADSKESATVGAHLSAIFLFASGGLYFCGQIIGEFNSYKSAIAIIDEKLKNEKEQRLKDQQLSDEKLKNEKEQRSKDQQITDEKLKLSDEKLKNAEHRLKKGNLW